jgi:hypothetical protein
VAGIISLLNDYRISNGKAPLGWLNPWLYSEGLNDITSGSNPGCGTNGFSAIAGWDPVNPVYFVSSFSKMADSSSIGHGSRDARLSQTGGNT